MNILKKHWSLIMWIIIAIIMPLHIKIDFLTRQFISWPYFILFYIIPPCLLITGIWYGITAERKKYLFIPLPFIAYFINDIILFKSLDGWFNDIGFYSGWYYSFIRLYTNEHYDSSIGFAAIGIVLTVIFTIGLLIGEGCKRLKNKKLNS